jgi:hypothetical protein
LQQPRRYDVKALRTGKPRNVKLVAKIKDLELLRSAARCCGHPKVRHCQQHGH